MKLTIIKEIVEGKFLVKLKGFEFTAEEREYFKKFGFPAISTLLHWSGSTRPVNLSVNAAAFSDQVIPFDSEKDALNFIESLRIQIQKVKQSMVEEDKYSGEITIE